MATITLSIPKEIKEIMDRQPQVKWTEIFRQGLIKKVEQLEKFEQLIKKGKI